jgi:hypothetical protein
LVLRCWWMPFDPSLWSTVVSFPKLSRCLMPDTVVRSAEQSASFWAMFPDLTLLRDLWLTVPEPTRLQQDLWTQLAQMTSLERLVLDGTAHNDMDTIVAHSPLASLRLDGLRELELRGVMIRDAALECLLLSSPGLLDLTLVKCPLLTNELWNYVGTSGADSLCQLVIENCSAVHLCHNISDDMEPVLWNLPSLAILVFRPYSCRSLNDTGVQRLLLRLGGCSRLRYLSLVDIHPTFTETDLSLDYLRALSQFSELRAIGWGMCAEETDKEFDENHHAMDAAKRLYIQHGERNEGTYSERIYKARARDDIHRTLDTTPDRLCSFSRQGADVFPFRFIDGDHRLRFFAELEPQLQQPRRRSARKRLHSGSPRTKRARSS